MKKEKKQKNIQMAAIDIGSNAIRMVIAQVATEGKIDVLERLNQAVHLGQDTFRTGYIDRESMRHAVTILRNYRQVITTYGIKHILAVATSSVREAVNADVFIDRIAMATGFEVEVIDSSEEGRLTVSAIRNAIGSQISIGRKNTIIAEVGGGSTLITVLQRGKIIQSVSMPIGSIRLNEIFADSSRKPDDIAKLLTRHIASALSNFNSVVPLSRISAFIALGGDVMFAAKEVGHRLDDTEFYTMSKSGFAKTVEKCKLLTPLEISTNHGMSFSDAERLMPALIVYQNLLGHTEADELLVSPVSMRDGLLLELVARITGKEDSNMSEAVVNAAKTIATKYQMDTVHCQQVCNFCERLFDDLKPLHGMNNRQKLLLKVAAMLHEIGMFVSARAHHKHSYYLIANTEIFGLNHSEIMIVANIARYHRKNSPKPTHTDYINLPRQMRIIICRLAALLRIADALECERSQQVEFVKTEITDDQMNIYVRGGKGLVLEKREIAQKSDLFEDVFGLRVRLAEVIEQ